MDKRNIPRRFFTGGLRLFFHLLYHEFSWSYDLVADTVSLGRWRAWVMTSVPELNGEPILEIGHGPGHLQVILASSGRKMYGIDASPQMSRLACQRLKQAQLQPNLVTGLGQKLPFPDGRFAQVFATFPSDYIFQQETLDEIKRVLKADGELLVIMAAWIRSPHPLDRAAAGLFRFTGQTPDFSRLWIDPFIQAGFTVTHHRVSVKNSEVLHIHACLAENE